jgi:hypothetical protein
MAGIAKKIKKIIRWGAINKYGTSLLALVPFAVPFFNGALREEGITCKFFIL